MARSKDGAEELRICCENELDALMELQESVLRAMPDSELFFPTSRELNRSYMKSPNLILAAFSGGRLIAYCSLVFHGNGEENLGWDLGWPASRVLNCAVVDTVVVDPEFRGRGLQRRLVHQSCKLAAERHPGVCLLTTVSPKNLPSLNNMQAEGFEVLVTKEKYGGLERYILIKNNSNYY